MIASDLIYKGQEDKGKNPHKNKNPHKQKQNPS